MPRKLNYPSSQDEILETKKLFQKEAELEREEFSVKTNSVPLKERIETGVSLYPLEIQETEFFLGDTWKIHLTPKFSLPKFHSFHAGVPVSLFRGEERKFGSIQRFQGSSITVLVDGELPDWLEEGNIGMDLFYSEKTYKEGERALDRVWEDKPSSTDKRNLLLGYKDFSYYENEVPSSIAEELSPEFNQSQRDAILSILKCRDALVIQGPPGTGKTSVLVEAIRLLIKMGKKVLVSTPTNSALDLLLEKILPHKLSPVRIGQMTRVSENLINNTLDYMIDKHKMNKTISKYKKEANNLKKKSQKFHRNFGAKEREERQSAKQDLKGIWEAIRNTERMITKEIIHKNNPVLATNVAASGSILNHEKFDVCILDEATQSLEPVAWIPLLRAEAVILTGDKNQLPPTILSDDKKLLETLFIKSGKSFENSERSCFLNIQYRMEEEILGFSNKEFYDNKVLTDSTVVNRPKIYQGIFKKAIVFVDTAGTGFEEEKSLESESTKNTGEAKLISSILERIFPALELPVGGYGIIAPYKEQVFCIQENLLSEMEGIEVATVDSFQGREKDAIILSLTRSNELGEIGFLKDYRRMNVSLTRARKLLIVVGDSTTLQVDPFYSRFLDYIQNYGQYLSAYEYL